MPFSEAGRSSAGPLSVSPSLAIESAPKQLEEGVMTHDPDSEAVVGRARPSPVGPSKEERELHEASGHALYRSWCRACVAGRGRSDPHTTVDKDTRATPIVAFDYAYLEKRADVPQGETPSPILISRCSKTWRASADVLPCKGTGVPYCIETLCVVFLDHGLTRFIAKCDTGPAMLDLRKQAAALARSRHGLEIIFEESPEYDSQSNGLAEGAVRDIKALVRTLRHATEELHGLEIGPKHRVLPFLINYAATALNIGRRGPDGCTPHFRLRGKEYRRALPPFGEKVNFMFAGKRESRLQDRWGVGLYLGLISRSSLYLVGTKEGVHRARTIKRMIITERADADLLNTFIGVPWMLQPGAIAMQPTIIYAEPEVEASELPPIPERAAARPRQVYLRKHVELKRHGYTAGCPGCEAAQGDMPAKPHTATCRARVEASMMAEGSQGQVRVTESLLKRSLDQGGTAVPMDTTTTPTVLAPQSGPASVSRPGANASSSSTTIVHARPEIEEPSARRARHLPAAGAEMDVAILGALEAEVQCYGLSGAEVAEIFGPGRFTSVSSAFDLRPGHAMDLRSGYDFNNAADRKRGELEFLDEFLMTFFIFLASKKTM